MLSWRLFKSLSMQFLTRRNPTYIHYFITYRCNLRCLMCDVPNHSVEHELDLDEIRRLAGILAEMNAGIINIGGGEPFLRKDLADIVGIFSRHGFSVRIQTNGYAITEAALDHIFKHRLGGISLSIDSLDPKIQGMIHKRDDALDVIASKIALLSKYLSASNTYPILNIVVSRLNYRDLRALIDFAARIGWYCSFAPVHLDEHKQGMFRSFHQRLRFTKQDMPELRHTYEQLVRLKKAGAAIANSSKYLANSMNFFEDKKPYFNCRAGESYFLVRPDGGFALCNDLDSFDNILRRGFIDDFRSPSFRDRCRKAVSACPGCYYPCWAEMELLSSPKVICERMKTTIPQLITKRPTLTKEQLIELMRECQDHHNLHD